MPECSIIIITWNNKNYVSTCLDKLLAQTFRDFEVLIVDNGSADGSFDSLTERYSALDIHIERLNANQGFATANNVGARLARGKWLALLNTDAFPEPDWLNNLLQTAKKYPRYSFFHLARYRLTIQTFWTGPGMCIILAELRGGGIITSLQKNLGFVHLEYSAHAERLHFTCGKIFCRLAASMRITFHISKMLTLVFGSA